MSSWLFFLVYRYFLIPFLLRLLNLLHPFLNKKIREMIDERKYRHWPELSSRPIWIHASSGEIEYAKPLIRAIKEKWPQRTILVTFFSPSAKKLIKNIPGVDVLIALPWDHRKLVKKFLNHFKPEILLVARTDAWPEMLYQTKKQNIPSLLFSATFAKNSRRKGWLASPLTRFAMNQFSGIHCVSEEDSSEIKALGVNTEIKVSGDTRYDQVIWRLKNPNPVHQLLTEKIKSNVKTIFVAGSTWPEDEKIILPAIHNFLNQGGKLILAPHETNENRLQKLTRNLSTMDYTWLRYSQATTWVHEQILIIDQIGILQEIYTWGNLAFVGGSFKDRVHSVMEPLAAGLPVLVGPFHSNNREALYFQNKFADHTPAVNVTYTEEDFKKSLQNLILLNSKNPKIKPHLQQLILEKAGATNAVLWHISQTLDSDPK